MNSLGLPQGFEVFHDVKDMDDLDDDISLGSTGDISLVTLTDMPDEGGEGDGNNNKEEEDSKLPGNQENGNNNHNGENGNGDHNNNQQHQQQQQQPDHEPRMVSHDSMATVRAANVHHIPKPQAKSSSQTPWDSLKSLVEKKKNSRGGNLMANNNHNNNNGGGGGMVSRPSTFLREALYGSNYTANYYAAPQQNQEFEPSQKKPKVEDCQVQNHVLHKACMKRGAEAEVIAAILKIDNNLATISHQIFQVKDVYDCASYKCRSTKVKEKYCYPLNIAIRNHVQYAAIELLVKAAPQISGMPDGSMKEGSLSVMLKHNPQDARLADLLLLSNPTCATLVDRHQNSPLHIACQYGASLGIVKHLCIIHPQALKMKNQFGQTPIQVAQRSIRSRHLASYLFTKQRGIYS